MTGVVESAAPKSRFSERRAFAEKMKRDLGIRSRGDRRLLVEQEALQSPEATLRTRRITIEKKELARNPEQRKSAVLDYIRRGYFSPSQDPEQKRFLMPELIQALPKLLESGIIDFSAPDYSHSHACAAIISAFKNIEQSIQTNDSRIRLILVSLGMEMKDERRFLDQGWMERLIAFLTGYEQRLSQGAHAQDPRSPGKRKHDIVTKTIESLKKEFSLDGDFPKFLSSALYRKKLFEVQREHVEDPMQQFLIAASLKGGDRFFSKYPRSEDYHGSTVEHPPRITDIRPKKGIKLIKRDSLPAFGGGVIFDGNFGYDAQGNLIQPPDRMIIDHHDALDEKRYDTATHMAGRIWNGSGTLRDLINKRSLWKRYESEPGRIFTILNEPDTDALLALWSFRNPLKARQYRELLDKISYCGDFLVGSTVFEYGAKARDYDYIIRNYLKECEENVLRERTEGLRLLLTEREAALENIKRDRSDSVKRMLALEAADPTCLQLNTEFDKIQSSSDFSKKEKEQRMRENKERKNQRLAEIASQEIELRARFDVRLRELNEEIGTIRKAIEKNANPQTTPLIDHEREQIVTHMLTVIEDIVIHPFKYKRFLEQGRREEEEAIKQATAYYERGDIEIMPYRKDPDILILSPLGRTDVPHVESIDGLYFFLRQRVDFNKPIIVTTDKDSYMVAINTQNHAILEKYDFNELIKPVKRLEAEYIQKMIEKIRGELSQVTDSKQRERLEKELRRAEVNQQRLVEGRLWRNRTQMAFSFHSYIPRDEFLRIVETWKRSFDEQFLKKKKK